MKRIITAALFAAMLLTGGAQAKKMLGHDDFDAWRRVGTEAFSDNGLWAAYRVYPQEGDGVLTFRNTKNGKTINIDRGYRPAFTRDGLWAVALIQPTFQQTRKAKIAKKKDFDMPQDSLAIVNLRTGEVERIPRVISYRLGRKGGATLAYLSCDTAYIKPAALKDKKAGRPLVVRNLATGATARHPWVKSYTVSDDGRRFAAYTAVHKSDSVAKPALFSGNAADPAKVFTYQPERKFYDTPAISADGARMAFLASDDSLDTGTRLTQLYLVDLDAAEPQAKEINVMKSLPGKIRYMRPDTAGLAPDKAREVVEKFRRLIKQESQKDLFLNQYSSPRFSHNGRRLIVGVAPKVAPDDTTIVDFERADLDIWRWDAPYTPPQENHNVDKARKHTYPVAIDLASLNQVLLAENPLHEVEPANRWDTDVALVRDPSKHFVSRQWDYAAPEDLYVINLNTGKSDRVGEVHADCSELSPAGKYVLWFADRNYYAYDTATGATRCLTADFPYPLWDEDQDIPLERQAYGVAGWTEGDNAVLVYDKHDIWSLDPTGAKAPMCLTAGDGRATGRRFRYQKTDPEQVFINPSATALLRVFDYKDKRHGFASLPGVRSPRKPAIELLDTYMFTQLKKAKDAPAMMYQRANFSTSPDVWIAASGNPAKAVRVTDANPQMKDYSWGTAQLVKWHAYNGKESEGVLYLPEDYDPSRKYPMLVVFYERSSEELYYHYTMEPSWSWVNYPFYVSRGYVIFVPDVHYTPGVPGESAYNYICSGVEEMCRRFPGIDKKRIGIDGQSWGGYQTAFLVTRTNMFACAGSGAPVANMTSAFGGIRWESGSSRQAQYEQGQSRIGRNLWEAPQLYIANSPVFYADRVNTPLLIMHNDKDGAVPWYQGIEMFMALRRLQKPVWMLQYNGEAHNLRQRKNRKDITIRLQQFFDHYLKDAPMPEWMKNGIPATRKGQEMGTGLIFTESEMSVPVK